ncbi:MAG: 50S ribosomal protein L29 [Patescibacteria group bacterium]
MVDLEELQKIPLKSLLKELGEARIELFKVKFEVETGQEKASHKIKKLKKYIAQILTIINDHKHEN